MRAHLGDGGLRREPKVAQVEEESGHSGGRRENGCLANCKCDAANVVAGIARVRGRREHVCCDPAILNSSKVNGNPNKQPARGFEWLEKLQSKPRL